MTRLTSLRQRAVPRYAPRSILAVLMLFALAAVTGPVSPQSGYLNYGDTISGDVSAGVPSRLYHFNGRAGDSVSIIARAGAPVRLTLLASSLGQVALSSANDEVEINHVLPQTGVYHLVVARVGATSGEYTLLLESAGPVSMALLQPEDGAVLRFTGSVTFAWEPVPAAFRYLIEREACNAGYTNCAPLVPVVTDSNSVTIEHNDTRPARWRVRPTFMDGSEGEFSAWRTFSFDLRPALLQPAPGAALPFTGSMIFAWEPVPGAFRYLIEREACDTGYTNCAPMIPVVTDSNSIMIEHNDTRPARWRVRPTFVDGSEGEFSAWATFSFDLPTATTTPTPAGFPTLPPQVMITLAPTATFTPTATPVQVGPIQVTASPIPVPLEAPLWLEPAQETTIIDQRDVAITFRWQAVAGAEAYRLRVIGCTLICFTRDRTIRGGTEYALVVGSAGEFEWNPAPGDTYTISVRALRGESSAGWQESSVSSEQRFVVYQPAPTSTPLPAISGPPQLTATPSPAAFPTLPPQVAITLAPTVTPTPSATPLALPGGPQLTVTPSPAPSVLTGTHWRLTALNAALMALPDTLPRLEFAEPGRVTGNGGCNGFSASYSVSEQLISFGSISASRVFCAGAGVMEQEAAYFAALEAATSFVYDGGQLIIAYGPNQFLFFVPLGEPTPTPLPVISGPALLTATPLPAPSVLTGTYWRLTALNAALMVLPDTLPRLEFTEPGRVTGNGGCNGFSASYSVSEQLISFGPISASRVFCAGAGVMEQEAAYFAALEAATSFVFDGSQLIVIYGPSQFLFFVPLGEPTPTPAAFPTLPPQAAITLAPTSTPTIPPTPAYDPVSDLPAGDIPLALGLGPSHVSFELVWPPAPVNYANIRAYVSDPALLTPAITYELRLECALAPGDNVQWSVFGAPDAFPLTCDDAVGLAFTLNRPYWDVQVMLDHIAQPVRKAFRLAAAPVDAVAPVVPPLDLALSFAGPAAVSGALSFPQGMRDTSVTLVLPTRDPLPAPVLFEVTVTCAGRVEPLRWNILNVINPHQPPGFSAGPHLCGTTVPFAYSSPEVQPYIAVWYDWPAAQSFVTFTVTARPLTQPSVLSPTPEITASPVLPRPTSTPTPIPQRPASTATSEPSPFAPRSSDTPTVTPSPVPLRSTATPTLIPARPTTTPTPIPARPTITPIPRQPLEDAPPPTADA